MSLDYEHLMRLCLKYWKWIIGATVIGFVGGYLYAKSQTAIYETFSTIEVTGHDSSVTSQGQSLNGSPELLKTFEQLLQTKDLAERVVRAENLNVNTEFLAPYARPPVSVEAATSLLADITSIRIRPPTLLIDITVDHPSPKMAKFLADRLAEEAGVQQIAQNVEQSETRAKTFDTEISELQKKVVDAERKITEYERAHPGEVISPDSSVDIMKGRLQEVNQQYLNAQAQSMLLQERYGPNHPKLIQQQKLVEELHNELVQVQSLTIDQAGKNSVEYETLKMESDSLKAQLTELQKHRNDVVMSAHIGDAGILFKSQADLPLAPVKPSKTRSAAIGGFIGLICGLGFVFGIYFIDGTLRTVTQAEHTLGTPVIAAVPILTEKDGKSVLPTYSDPQSFVAEAFRGLRASLLLHDRENPVKTILVVSAVPGEGKSFCAANLAVTFAQAGLKTLLIDADLRLPTMHTYFNVPDSKGVGGFANFLTGKATLANAVVTSPIPTLDLLLTITPAESPAELLSNVRMPLLLDEVAGKYDRVIIDSAPINAVSDTMLIMPKADAVLLVVRASSTPASESKSALQKIYANKMKPLGLILNYLAPHSLKSYAYGYSYGQKPKEKYAK